MLDQFLTRIAVLKGTADRIAVVASTAFGISTGFLAFAQLLKLGQSAELLVLTATLALITLLCLSWVVYREFTLVRRAKIANTIDSQLASSQVLKNLSSFLEKKLEDASTKKEVFVDDLNRARTMIDVILNDYASIYSVSTSTRCMARVILIHEDGEHVFTLARDRVSASENRYDDEIRKNEKLDKLIDNTAFDTLTDGRKNLSSFLENDLTKNSNYASSDLKYFQTYKSDPRRWREQSWPLLYKSTIAFPIRQEKNDDLGIEAKCVGFLAIESVSRGAFVQRWDEPLGKALCNNLYRVLILYSQLDSLIVREPNVDSEQAPSVHALKSEEKNASV